MPDNFSLQYSPSFERNIEPISKKFLELLPQEKSSILEIGSGTGQHSAHLAKKFPHIEFHPSELAAESLTSINLWAEELKVSNVRLAITLNVSNEDWRVQEDFFSALLAFNMIHYSPWKTTEQLFRHSGRYLTDDAQIIFYGPFKIDGTHTSDSNADFDQWLKEKHPTYGVRDIGDVDEIAKRHGFKLDALHPMPANNFMPVFKRV